MELKRYLRVVASTGDDDDDYSMVEISNRRAREAADLIEKLEEQAHYANGVADLAMKHRDYAEQRVEKLEAALAHIYAWYPVSVSHPAQTIEDIREFARKALENKDDPQTDF